MSQVQAIWDQLVKGHEIQSVLQFHADNKSTNSSISSNNIEKQKNMVPSSVVQTVTHTIKVLLAMQSMISHLSYNSIFLMLLYY